MNKEKVVAEYLFSKGFTVSVGDSINSNGVDIVAIKNGKNFLIEVKSAIKSTRSYKVNGLCKSGLNSTHIAIVTPKNNVIIDTLSDHKKLCSKDGSRRITGLINFYDC